MKRLLIVCLLFRLTPSEAQTRPRLDTTTFVVMGEGLAAGMANYGLSQETQQGSFPALVARQLDTPFPQPLIQGPGLEAMFGLPRPEAQVPSYPQTTVRVFPRNPQKKPGEVDKPTLFVLNLSLPGWKVSDSLTRRPNWPLIQPSNPQQTSINLILGTPALFLENSVPLWTQLEYARAMNPTLALVELGYYELLEAAAAGDPSLAPDAAAFSAQFTTIVKTLRESFAEVWVCTIPNPLDTAYFSTPAAAARFTESPESLFTSGYQLDPADLVTRIGLFEIGNQLLSGTAPSALGPKALLRAGVGRQIAERTRALNAAITTVARENGANVFDLGGLLASVRGTGVNAGGQRLTADYLGGFYSLDGVYPSLSGHAVIANEFLRVINAAYGRSFRPVDVGPVFANDPALAYKTPQ